VNNETIILKTISELNISDFEICMFKNNFSVLIITGKPSDEQLLSAWNEIYTEFIDLSGMAETNELEISKSIFYLNSRVKKIELYILLQRESLNKLGVPCIVAFDKIRIYGHKLKWNKEHPDIEDFKRQLNIIETNEKRYNHELLAKQKELLDVMKKKQNGDVTVWQKRKEFVRLKNNIGKFGFKIDNEKTTVEEFALMVHDYNEAIELQNKN
jgi:hypothetical protein